MTEQETRCSDTLSRALDKCQSSIGKAKEGSRLRTGTFLDELMGGLKRGDLTVLVGKTGTGKSALARNMAMSISSDEAEHVLLAPLQDASEEAAILRLAAIEGGVPLAVLDQERMSKADRIDVLDAIDGIRGHNIDIAFSDGLSLTPMLFERVLKSFNEDLARREIFSKSSKANGDDVLFGSGAVIIDTMTLLSDVDDIREGVRDLKSMACGSNVAVVVTVADAELEYLSDAGCVILVEACGRNEERGALEVKLTVVKDGTSAALGRSAKGLLDLATLRVIGNERPDHAQ